jgi:hypothetical protein
MTDPAVEALAEEVEGTMDPADYGCSGPDIDAVVAGLARRGYVIVPTEQAAIGAAVERLRLYRNSFILDYHVDAWIVKDRGIEGAKGVGRTLPEAIGAALDD